MAVSRGPQDHRRQAKNYIQKEAQRRLDETVPTFNQQVMNSLFVDAVQIDYFHVHDRVGKPCTCKQTAVDSVDVISADESGVAIEVENAGALIPSRTKTESIQLQDSIFGDSVAEQIYEDSPIGVDVNGYDPSIPDILYEKLDKEGNVLYQENVLQASNDCPICYNTRKLPGYSKYGFVRSVLCTWDISAIEGATVDKAAAPHIFNVIASGGFVEFELFIPRYFESAAYAIRNGKSLLKEPIWYKGILVDEGLLRRFAGSTIPVQVKAKQFTHLIVEFASGGEKIRGNISAETQALDYTLRDTIQNFTVVLPPTLHDIRVQDILVVPQRRLVLRVIDKERKVTADLKQLEWVVQTRVVQPTESIKNINKTFKF